MAQSRRIGKYEILEELGRGGFATVYKARDTRLDRVVALKVLHPYWREDPGFAERFQREARAAANLRHSNIVTVFEADEADGQLFIGMEYLPGRSLKELLSAEGALPLERAQPILEQIAEALDYAHEQGVVHRDIKPANVMVEDTPRGKRVTLLDFGLVKALQTSTALTSHGTLLGSPEYMAPEQADPNRASEIGPAADRYALGIVAYQMLTGRVPFPGDTPATLYAHEHKPVPLPRSLRPGLPRGVEQALLKMLAKAPAERFTSCAAFVGQLRAAQPTSEQARPAITLPAPGWSWVVAALVGALVLVAVIAALVSTGNQAGQAGQSTAPTPALGTTRTRPADGMVMVYVPDGTFQMGSNDGDTDEQPVHEVTLDSFWIDRTEVTNAQYARCVKDGKCSAPSESSSYTPDSYYGESQYADHPVIWVSWDDANDYCAWAEVQLPTEAQWEYAARGPQATEFPWGNTFDGTKVNYCDTNCTLDWADKKVDDGFADIAPVSSYPEGASWVGALDMVGNVWEWVADWYGNYPSELQVNPTGPTSEQQFHVLRGGGWGDAVYNVRAADRGINTSDYRLVTLGFRCVSAAPGE
ncbi:MAG TPA: bifunctional serine/threonine-protein kinase/formylglycine-generating enzyme family protein [Anaerolineae bacterium]|nr:bifunctional serine/threonine-protein kinase/formylglycine-generating enzyme family protein [Anaerolineae bacterium]